MHKLTEKICNSFDIYNQATSVELAEKYRNHRVDKIIREYLEGKVPELSKIMAIMTPKNEICYKEERVREHLDLTPDPKKELAERLDKRFPTLIEKVDWPVISEEALKWMRENKDKL